MYNRQASHFALVSKRIVKHENTKNWIKTFKTKLTSHMEMMRALLSAQFQTCNMAQRVVILDFHVQTAL
jgi:hypothetical protein